MQLPICLLLNLEQMLRFDMNQILEPLLCFSIDQIGEQKCREQRKQTDDNNDDKQMAHVRLELCIALRQHAFLYLDVAAHLSTNRIHQPLAPAIAYSRQYGCHVMVTAHLNDMRQFH